MGCEKQERKSNAEQFGPKACQCNSLGPSQGIDHCEHGEGWGLFDVQTTRLITAIPNDTDPVILVWDLRNANAPERVRTF